MTDLRFKGFDALRLKAQQLTVDVRERLAVNAARAGARVIADRARLNAIRIDDPETGRRIAANIATRYRKRRSQQSGDTIVSIGVAYEHGRIPKGNPDTGPAGNTPHWHLVHNGTERVAARPFLTLAALATENEVFDAIQQNLSRGLDRELNKL